MFKLYGEDMREIAKGIVRDVHAANDKHFVTEFDERLAKIDDILSGCSLLLEYIQICVDEHIISVKKGGILDQEGHGCQVYERVVEKERWRTCPENQSRGPGRGGPAPV